MAYSDIIISNMDKIKIIIGFAIKLLLGAIAIILLREYHQIKSERDDFKLISNHLFRVLEDIESKNKKTTKTYEWDHFISKN